MLATGVFSTVENPNELNKRSFAATMLRLFPDGSAPLFGLTGMAGRSRAVSSTHGYFSKTMTFIKTTTTGVDGTSENIPVASSVGMVRGMVLYNPRTRENLWVKSVTNAGQIVAQRGFGRVAAAVMNNADVLIQVGTAFEEGSVRPASRRLRTVYIPNFTQILRNAWALTDTARASLAEQGFSNIAESRRDCGLFHSVDAETAIIWGQPLMDTTGETPVHTTQGIIDAIYQYAPENVNPAGPTTDYGELVQLFEPVFRFSTDMSNPRSRLVLTDSLGMQVINDIGRKSGNVQIMQTETSFGMSFTQFKFYKGTLAVKEHPLFNGLEQEGIALIVDIPALKLAYMDGRDTINEEYNVKNRTVENGVDAVGGSLTSEFAVELINPYSCGLITGLTAGVMEPVLTQEVTP